MSSEPSARWGHSAVAVGEKVYVWGGCTADMPRDCSNDYKTQLLSKVFVFDIQSSNWIPHQSTGVPPKAVRGAAVCTTDDHNRIFTFGGYCGHGYHWYNELHELKFQQDHIQWRLIESVNNDVAPTTKQDCGIVCFDRSDNMSLCVFGGAGNKRGKPNDWTVLDELHVFNLVDSTWYVPDVSGSCPPPCSGFSFDMINIRQALLFGGKTIKDSVLNDVFLLSLDKWMWQKIPMALGIELPMPRESHCSICIGSHIIVIGGITSKMKIVADCWVFHTSDHTWKKINLPSEMTERISPIIVGATINENYQIITFGGLKYWITGKRHSELPMMDKTIISFLEVSNEIMPSYWYDLSAMGLQIKELHDKLKEKSMKLLETRESLGTTQAKIKTLESTMPRHIMSSQGSIKLEVDGNGYRDENMHRTPTLITQQSEPAIIGDISNEDVRHQVQKNADGLFKQKSEPCHIDDVAVISAYSMSNRNNEKRRLLNSTLLDKSPKKLDLQKLLAPIENQWRPIAEALKVDHGSIMSVENNAAYTDTVRLSHILQLWIEQKPSPVTWRTIIDAIEEPPVKNVAIANEIVCFLLQPDTISRT